MKISMLGTLPPLKGISYYCWYLSHALAARTDVEFFTFRHLYPEFLYPGGTKSKDVKDIVGSQNPFRVLSVLNIYNPLSWISTGLKMSGDIVHVQFWSLPVVPVYLTIFSILKIRRKKIIITLHNIVPHESSRFDRFLIKMVLKFSDRYIVHSKRNKEQLAHLFHIPVELISRVPMGPHNIYTTDQTWDRETSRRALNIQKDTKVLLFFGNIRDYKGVDDFIRVCALVKKSFAGQIAGLIVGQPWKSFEKYDQQIEKLGVSENIFSFLEYVPDHDVFKYFYACDVLLLPYKQMHGQSAVGNIAVDLTIPMVVTDVGGLPELVLDEKSVVAPQDVEAMAGRVCEIFTQKKLAEKLKRDAECIKNRNSWENISLKTLEVYHSAGLE